LCYVGKVRPYMLCVNKVPGVMLWINMIDVVRNMGKKGIAVGAGG
jgi:hypothetical protein